MENDPNITKSNKTRQIQSLNFSVVKKTGNHLNNVNFVKCRIVKTKHFFFNTQKYQSLAFFSTHEKSE